MERESFEDQEVADYLNKYFISIKVDKEERPDVDSIYMTVCQNLTGSGGWPLTIFMFPDQKPFFAGTYYPKRSRYHMPGLLDLLEAVQEKWETNREDLFNTSQVITDSLEQNMNRQSFNKEFIQDLIKKASFHFQYSFDKEYGGFGREPKFPTPHNLMYLMRLAYHENNKEILKVVEKTLDAMYEGGIFDHIGYGFSRYSTDRIWLVPHFEKMLYDNSLLVITYLEAYQMTGKLHYKQIAEMTIEYILRELTSDEGGFFCAQDADSEGVEGKYYVFSSEEIIQLLGEEDGNYFNQYYGITEEGNFEGKNIPNRLHAKVQRNGYDEGQRKGNDISGTEHEDLFQDDRIVKLRKLVYEYRLDRTKLHKDDKILTSWNGLMITAFAKAYQILQKEEYLKAAKRADQFLQDKLSKGIHLSVHYRDGVTTGNGHIDDYAFYIWALISLYEATFEPEYLIRALGYVKELINQFFDKEGGGFYLYASESETLIHRPKEIYDGAIPSGNSVAAYVLHKLCDITGDTELIRIMEMQMDFILSNIAEYPGGHSFSLMAVLFDAYPQKELVCLVQNEEELQKLKEFLATHFLPNITVLVKSHEISEQLYQVADYLKDYDLKDNKITFYLCENHTCLAPFHTFDELENFIIKL